MIGNLKAMPLLANKNTTAFMRMQERLLSATIAMQAFGTKGAGVAAANALPLTKKIKDLAIGFRMLAVATFTALGPFLLIAAGIALLVGIFVLMYKNSENLRNALSNLGKNLRESLGKAMEKISKAFSDASGSTETLTNVFKFLGDGVAILVDWFGGALMWAIDTVASGLALIATAAGTVTKWFKEVFGSSEKTTEGMVALTDSQEDAKRKMEETAASAAGLYTEFGNLSKIQATVRTEIENTFDKVTGGARSLINARDAAKSFKEETSKLTTTIKDGTLSFEQKEDALYQYSASVLDAIKKDIELGGTQESAQKILDTGTEKFIENAKAIGLSETAAKNLATNLALTPATITKTFKASGLGDLQKMVEDLGKLETIAGNATSREGRFDATQYTQIKAEVSAKLSLIRGETDSKPLYVEVTNSSLNPPERAVGGPVSANKTYLVGEKGPELFTSNSAGKITPNGQLGNMSGNSAPTIIVNPSQGMDEREIANLVSRRLAFMQRGV
jgi:hypothetical protein